MEIWKDIKCYEGLYQVSNLGRVKSFKCGKERILKASLRGIQGYVGVGLRKDGKTTPKYTHRLVADAFLEKPSRKCVVDHINNIPSDNRVENLQFISQRENLLKNHPKKNSVFEGISLKKDGSYHANIQLGYKKIFLGGHRTDKEYLSGLYTKAKELIHLYNGDDKSFRELVRSNLI